MIKVKKIIIRNSSIMLKDIENLELLREALANVFEVGISSITTTYEELEGILIENDSCVKSLMKIKEEVVDN